MNPCWLRDHVHELKGFKWWEKDLHSGFDHFLQTQHSDGFFYEMIVPINDGHPTFVKPKFRVIDEKNNLAYVRLEIEADIEYLMVEGVYQAWQASGDDEWMLNALPPLIKGMEYAMTDPTRWEPHYGLVKRPFTIDTWDFTYGTPENDRTIRKDTPMSIMHGDNSGMYQAALLLSKMCAVAGEKKESRRWLKVARKFKERTNKLCWNGKFYTHQIHLNHQGAPGVDETETLSLSNTYDINRGLTNHRQAISIINEYKRRRELTQREYFAEWFSIHPPYPEFKAHSRPPGNYINGGIAGFAAGELAKAALCIGEEDYGVDILSRVAEKVEKDGEIAFLYTPDGRNQGGGPAGWSAASLISAILEGLAGIKDCEKLLKRAIIAPRWVVAGEKEVNAFLSYGASEAYIAYSFSHNEKTKAIEINLRASRVIPNFHILLPKGKKAIKVLCNRKELPFKTSKIEKSYYCDFNLEKPIKERHIIIKYT